MDKVTGLASENGVVIFNKNSCCLCYAVNILFQVLRAGMEKVNTMLGCNALVPAVFISGRLVGLTDEIMSLHLSGSLIPMLKPY
ncbi:hypothetical protein Nepgr_004484 [Nepenthes gracilis]|uniref:Glutaredoxin n=1 Tax=Nepenthes gracilis TaxID=150966 RepID=A0AAD3S1G1_NEPGR|nr:hypothetical protein Nepgr_004484 [Nepenthes gracilis]